ncbi:hypothetical protein [Bifidobacterium colobi]|uniref:hypothetical protein n=1 Tax=Bifidobacterium colobi TaxID=2809026 RepID=UPI001BDBB870|nr:hypothetical protein [Bifidobacterium colobi]
MSYKGLFWGCDGCGVVTVAALTVVVVATFNFVSDSTILADVAVVVAAVAVAAAAVVVTVVEIVAVAESVTVTEIVAVAAVAVRKTALRVS